MSFSSLVVDGCGKIAQNQLPLRIHIAKTNTVTMHSVSRSVPGKVGGGPP